MKNPLMVIFTSVEIFKAKTSRSNVALYLAKVPSTYPLNSNVLMTPACDFSPSKNHWLVLLVEQSSYLLKTN